jgi:hypothetical protein
MADPVSKLIYKKGEAVVTAAKAYISGEPIQLANGQVGVYTGLRSVVSGDQMCVETEGIRQFPCGTSVTFSAGAQVHWDIANKTVVAAADGVNTFILGRAFVAKTSGQLVCQVDIDPSEIDDIENLVVDEMIVHHIRTRFTVAQINAGATLLAAIANTKYRIVDMALIAIGGAAATATTVDILATQSASAVKLMAAAVAGLTQNALLRAGATNGAILTGGLSFVANDANTAIAVGKTGSDLATATHVDVLVSYVKESA